MRMSFRGKALEYSSVTLANNTRNFIQIMARSPVLITDSFISLFDTKRSINYCNLLSRKQTKVEITNENP